MRRPFGRKGGFSVSCLATIGVKRAIPVGACVDFDNKTTSRFSKIKIRFSHCIGAEEMSKRKLANDDPAKRLALSASSIYLAAGLNIILGLIAYIFQVKFLQTLGFGILSAAIGFLFLVLGFFTQRRSLFALILAVILFSLEGVSVLLLGLSMLLSAFSAGNSLHEISEILQSQAILIGVLAGWFTLCINLPIQMLKGVGAIKKLKQETQTTVL
jgi:hypothetical protein